MFQPIKLIDIELSLPIPTIEGLSGYSAIKGLVRYHGTPLGYVHLPVVDGCCRAEALTRAVLEAHSQAILDQHLKDLISAPSPPEGWDVDDLVAAIPTDLKHPLPMVTVAVCTRDRGEDLALCLGALGEIAYDNLEILIVDNAPSDDSTETLVYSNYPDMRYVREPRPGLNWARNRAIYEAQGEILAFTDDDCLVDPRWVRSLVQVFMENPEAALVTGLVLPAELETDPQHFFEVNGGFGRGLDPKWTRVESHSRRRWQLYGTGQYGTGANMAYRRLVFDQIGWFDPALDVGTVTKGGGDLEMFFRALKFGHILVYEPKAIVRHYHRREFADLQSQIRNNGIGLYAYFVRSALNYPEERLAFLHLGAWWLWWWSIRRLILSYLAPPPVPRDLIWSELKGSLKGLTRYRKAERIAAEVRSHFGPQSGPKNPDGHQPPRSPKPKSKAVGVRLVDLSEPLTGLEDLHSYPRVCVYVVNQNELLGSFVIHNQYQPVSLSRLRAGIVTKFGVKLLTPAQKMDDCSLKQKAILALSQHYATPKLLDGWGMTSTSLRPDRVVSVVVATLDHPDDLRSCLHHLRRQRISRAVEIIVVDNNPASGLTPPVVAEFPGVILVNESRRGLAYARNAGFAACTGEIVVATDDDVTVPPDWLEKMVEPFVRPDVMVVTGNVLPMELETTAQQLFEVYGGLGRGIKPLEANARWFQSFQKIAVPTWELGATANSAFRTQIFNHPQIGLMDEALGPGMPSGVGEDTYLFYKVLQAGYTLVYRPSAYVWHRHRRSMKALRRQLFNYSKGHVAYHLTTLLHDGDKRVIRHLLFQMPIYRLWQILKYTLQFLSGSWFRGGEHFPLHLTLIEIWGNLVGPWALWRSRRRVKREGFSQAYIPPSERQPTTATPPYSPRVEQPVYSSSRPTKGLNV